MAINQRLCADAPKKLFLLFTIALSFIQASADQINHKPAGIDGNRSLKLRLIHRSALNLPQISAKDESFGEIHGNLFSGASFPGNIGQYFVELYLGNPEKPYFFIIDTGSDVMWIPCSLCQDNNSNSNSNSNNNNNNSTKDNNTNANDSNASCVEAKNSSSVFMAKRSSTFDLISCPSDTCYYVPPPQGTPACRANSPSVCTYSYGYSDGSHTRGVFAYDTVRMLASKSKLGSQYETRHFVELGKVAFGCGTDNFRPGSVESVGGVLGLGLGPISFSSQLGGNNIYGHKFSYCFPSFFHTANLTSVITFGEDLVASNLKVPIQYTPFIENPYSRGLYYVSIDSMRINGVNLPIPPDVWSIDKNGKGGAIIDSGTTLSFFRAGAYDVIVDAVKKAINYPLALPTAGLPLCYNVSGIFAPVSI